MSPSTTADRVALRRDTQHTRDRLLDVVGVLLAEQGRTFTLPELARRSGVATATVYRHFATVHDSHNEFYLRLIDQLVGQLETIPTRAAGRRRFDIACERWVAVVAGWGRAAAQIRSPEGFLERVHRDDRPTSALYAALEPIIGELIATRTIPDQSPEYAVLIWVTVFDERVIVDLTATTRVSHRRLAKQLADTVLHAYGATTP
jgi:AcrR family transcriptional regulator